MKKILSTIVYSLVAGCLFTVSAASAATSFSDVKESSSFYEEIMYLSENNIIKGTDNAFHPQEDVTRAAAATMIGRALGLDGAQRESSFSDVSSQSYAVGYIESAAEKGIVKGYPGNTFKPNEPVTRAEMAIFISRAFELEEELDFDYLDINPTMASYESILKVSEAGIAQGLNNGLFFPARHITRAEFSAFLARAMEPEFRVDVKSFKEPLTIQYDTFDYKEGDVYVPDYKLDDVNIHNGDLIIVEPNSPIKIEALDEYASIKTRGRGIQSQTTPLGNSLIVTGDEGVGQILIYLGEDRLSYTVVVKPKQDLAKNPFSPLFLEAAQYGHMLGCEFGMKGVTAKQMNEYYGSSIDESADHTYAKFGACMYDFKVPLNEKDLKVNGISKDMRGSEYTPSDMERLLGVSAPARLLHPGYYYQNIGVGDYTIQFLYNKDTKKLEYYRIRESI
ncbi:S-layer homology domain-containing protein [Rossellomorea vietnamensis]|uniref:S-layer homology domain-containing protein n=1 Tax=Rossellomorea vietnamensis TaxID=218284 RepID=UPI00077C79D7|nr:S-layer homology domain-containing protein [Rossellomorea vietnamensis]